MLFQRISGAELLIEVLDLVGDCGADGDEGSVGAVGGSPVLCVAIE